MKYTFEQSVKIALDLREINSTNLSRKVGFGTEWLRNMIYFNNPTVNNMILIATALDLTLSQFIILGEEEEEDEEPEDKN